ncbi:MAG TPA: metallophosphoesterase [Pyrinomonadaceae bacterium]|nr:metallophosphoesterase [Pyrinomonadaceae bacterium]
MWPLKWKKREENYRQARAGFFEAVKLLDRRSFLGVAGRAATIATAKAIVPPHSFQLVDVLGVGLREKPAFRFAYIADTHLYERTLNERFVAAAMRAVNDINALKPPPDFVLVGGDLAQFGQPKELELGKQILSELKAPLKMVAGEHDWYLDLGEKWQELFGPPNYSFHHKGVHFIGLMSVNEKDFWTDRKMTPLERMKTVAQLDSPIQSRFEVGEAGREWLRQALAKVPNDTPIVLMTHAPLYKYYRPWNFWTEDADLVQEILFPYRSVTVLHAHTHQVLTHRVKNIHFHGMLATSWPWPYAPEGLPKLTVKMDRVDPFDQLDGLGSGTVDVYGSGYVNKHYSLWRRDPITVAKAYLESWGKEAIPRSPEFPSY